MIHPIPFRETLNFMGLSEGQGEPCTPKTAPAVLSVTLLVCRIYKKRERFRSLTTTQNRRFLSVCNATNCHPHTSRKEKYIRLSRPLQVLRVSSSHTLLCVLYSRRERGHCFLLSFFCNQEGCAPCGLSSLSLYGGVLITDEPSRVEMNCCHGSSP